MISKMLFIICLFGTSIYSWESSLQIKLGSPISSLPELNKAIDSYNSLNLISNPKKASIDYAYQSQFSYFVWFNGFGAMASAGYEFIPLSNNASSQTHYSTFISLFQATAGPVYILNIDKKKKIQIYSTFGYFRGAYKDDQFVESVYNSHERYNVNTVGVKIGLNPEISLNKQLSMGFDASYRYLFSSNPKGSGEVTHYGNHFHGTTLYDLSGFLAPVNSFATGSPGETGLRRAVLDFSAFEVGITISCSLGL